MNQSITSVTTQSSSWFLVGAGWALGLIAIYCLLLSTRAPTMQRSKVMAQAIRSFTRLNCPGATRTFSTSISSGTRGESTIASVLLDTLVCPLSKQPLIIIDSQEMHCPKVGIAYPVLEVGLADGTYARIPVLVLSAGRVVE